MEDIINVNYTLSFAQPRESKKELSRKEFIKASLLLCFGSMSAIITGCDSYNKMLGIKPPYPSKPIKVIVPFTAGGSADTIARLMEKFSIKYFEQPFLTTNMPGGGATLGWNELAGAKPDGYTIGIVSNGTVIQPLYGQTRYNYAIAIEPLVQITSTPLAVVILANKPWRTIGDLVKYAEEHPGEIKYGHAGLGTGSNVAGEMFAKVANINIVQVPFQGDSESLAALLGGHVPLVFTLPTSIREYVKHGSLRVLALASIERISDPVYKNVPTFREQGLDIIFTSWWGVGAPKMIPTNIREQLEGGIIAIANDPEFRNNMESMGITVDFMEPDEFKQKWNNETVRLAKIVTDTGVAKTIAMQKN